MPATGLGTLANHVVEVGEPPLGRQKVWVPVEGCGGFPGPTGTQRLNPCQKDGWLASESLPKGFASESLPKGLASHPQEVCTVEPLPKWRFFF